MWVNFSRTIFLAGVFLENGSVVRGSKTNDALFKGWAPTFSEATIDEELAEQTTSKYLSAYNWDLLGDISVSSFLRLCLRQAI